MSSTSLKEKISDLIFWTIIFFILYIIVAYLLESSWLKIRVALPEVYGFIKDGLSITAGLLAPISALILFSDWKEQHVLKLVDEAAWKISEDIHDLYILSMQAFYKEPLEVSEDDIKLYEHSSKGSLHDLRRSIEIKEKIIKNYVGKNNDIVRMLTNLRELSLRLENHIRIKKHSTYKLKIEEEKSEYVDHLALSQYKSLVFSHRQAFEEGLGKMKKLNNKLEEKLKAVQI